MMGLFLEDIHEGLTVDLGSYHFTGDNILEFARKYDPQPFHLSEDGGLRGPFGGLSASGWHTAAGWMKCFVAVNDAARAKLQAAGKILPDVGPGPGFTNLKWLKPVFPGDLNSRPQWGIVFSLNEGFNQKNELVFSFEGKVLTARSSSP
jgi:acyl dehydratase